MTAERPEATLSYATEQDPPLRRLVIRTIERLTGQRRLREIYLASAPQSANFWTEAVRKLELRLRFDEAQLHKIPKDGPLVVVANHPFGVLDGIVLNDLISRVRPDHKILINAVLTQAREVAHMMLPIDFSETREALEMNLRSRRDAIAHARAGGAVAVFPAGAVSTAERPFGLAEDCEWKPFTAKLIQSSRATVVPIFFAGQNSRLFQLASRWSMTLRLSLLLKEVRDRIGSELPLCIGDPIPYAELEPITDRRALIAELKRRTYELSQRLPHAVSDHPRRLTEAA